MLNDARIRGFAIAFAALAKPTAETSIDQTIDAAYQLAFARTASDPEKQSMRAFIEQQKAMRGGDENLAVRDFCHLLLCTNEFVYVD